MDKRYSTWRIAATYIGTVVGAGFASGQEVLQFFGYFGMWGIVGLILATALFIFFGYAVLRLGHQLAAESHLEVMNRAAGNWIGKAVDAITTFFFLVLRLSWLPVPGLFLARNFTCRLGWAAV